jgi:hypothetical protein
LPNKKEGLERNARKIFGMMDMDMFSNECKDSFTGLSKYQNSSNCGLLHFDTSIKILRHKNGSMILFRLLKEYSNMSHQFP